MADSSNSTAGSQSTGSQTSTASTGSTTSGNGATTSNSTGNFSGGFPGLSIGSWGSPSSETEAAHASGVQGPGLANGNFGSSWSGNGNSGSGSGDYTYNNTSYSNNKSEPVMTVDEVYGKTDTATGISGNQSIVESQGDYTASSNEKSGVETSTFGKQDNITVTPESVTENKGLVDNSVIDSIEGLNFQQKDKESQDVMEAKKNRDEAEAEDKANQMRDSLKAITDPTVDEDANAIADEDAINQFQIGDRDEEVAAMAQDLQEKTTEAQKAKDDVQAFNDAVNVWKAYQAGEPVTEAEMGKAGKVFSEHGLDNIYDGILVGGVFGVNLTGVDVKTVEKANEQFVIATDGTYKQLQANRDEANKAVEQAQQAYDSIISAKYVGAEEAPAVTPESKAITVENTPSDTKQAFDKAIQNAVEKGADEKTVQAMTDIATSIDEAQTAMKDAIEHNDIPTYIEAQKQYNKNLNEALKIGNRLTQTDYNKAFVTEVAKANDFEVTLADGTKQEYSQFATNMATKSPEVAKAMYEAKAKEYEENHHPILAKIERAKAEMVQTWIGSKLTQADNQVRNQFIQMAKTDMRATYAAYNNVLSDPNATPEQKADASAAITQANGLMTASAALQASTGFLSGIGDSMKDGVYGTTDPGTLNAYQKTLNAIDNFAKITLGLGVTPGANKAYQNMYYMAGAKVNNSALFSKDWDGDGFALCQEYGNNAAAGMIAGAGELATGIALFFNPAMSGIGLNLVIDSITTFTNGLYGVQKDARKSEKYTQEVLSYFKEAQDIAAETGNKDALDAISSGITQIEDFELKADEVGNLDNWLEGSGSNTATNEKFNQSLSYDEWLKLIEADPTMREYAKKLIAEKKEK